MTDHHDNPLFTILLSAAAGMGSWLIEQHVTRALLVAVACGFVGGLAKAAGVWTWERAKRASKKRRKG